MVFLAQTHLKIEHNEVKWKEKLIQAWNLNEVKCLKIDNPG